MMLVRTLAICAAASGLLLVQSWLGTTSLDPWMAGACAVLGGVLVACIVYGRAGYLPIAFGAASALPVAWLGPTFPGWAFSVALWLAPRVALARKGTALVESSVLSALAAVVTGLSVTYAGDASLSEQIAAFVVAGTCIALPSVIVVADTPIAFAIRQAAAVIGGPVGEMLDHAASVQAKAPRKAKAWGRIVRLADARVALASADGRDASEQRARIEAELRELASELLPTVPPPPIDLEPVKGDATTT